MHNDNDLIERVYSLLAAADSDTLNAVERARELSEHCRANGHEPEHLFWESVQRYASERIFNDGAIL